MTSAEQKAEEICREEEGYCEDNGIWVPSSVFIRFQAAITTALREAGNAKLEEARQRVLEGHDEAWGNPAEQHAWDQAAQRIEALKSKD